MQAYCSKQMEELNFQMFSWIDMDKFEMQLIEFQSSSDFKSLWNAVPENIFMLKKLCNSITLHALFYICL